MAASEADLRSADAFDGLAMMIAACSVASMAVFVVAVVELAAD